jgi:ABC-type transport system involved in multi-copper enzyme maturation permease subunit
MRTVLPVIVRELREQSRRPVNYWLRGIAGALLLGLTSYQLLNAGATWARAPFIPAWAPMARPVAPGIFRVGIHHPEQPSTWLGMLEFAFQQFENRGGILFRIMNMILVATIWFVAPLLTADTLSRERRDGTLGLMFLTPLRAGDIVLAKFAAHALRAGGMFLAALPILILPLILGGVSWMDAAHAALLDASALCLALTAGLYASTRWTGHKAVFFGALAISAACAAAWIAGWALVKTIPALVWGTQAGLENIHVHFIHSLRRAVSRVTDLLGGNLSSRFSIMAAGAGLTRPRELLPPLGLLLLSLAISTAVFQAACRSVRAAQREGRPPTRAEAAVAWLGSPRLFLGVLDRIRQALLARIPVLWTELRSWRLRIAPWLLLLSIAAVEVWWVSDRVVAALVWGRPEFANVPLILLTGMCAIAAASAFQQERASGVLELLLTTPAGVVNVLAGKWLSLVLLVLPALALIGLVELIFLIQSISVLEQSSGLQPAWRIAGVAARLSLAAAVGLHFSLRFRAFIPALGATLGTMAAAIFARTLLLRNAIRPTGFGHIVDPNLEQTLHRVGILLEAALAIGFVILLYRSLARRQFAAR